MSPMHGAAFAATLSMIGAAWAQSPVTTADLNRQELDRLAGAAANPATTGPAMTYAITSPVSIVPKGFVRPPGYIGYQYPSATQYPFAWVYRYSGYPLAATYEYISVGASGYYAPAVFVDWQ